MERGYPERVITAYEYMLPALRLADNARLYLTINSDLEKRFREEVAKRLGMKKGNLQVAIEEAIKLWLRNKEGN